MRRMLVLGVLFSALAGCGGSGGSDGSTASTSSTTAKTTVTTTTAAAAASTTSAPPATTAVPTTTAAPATTAPPPVRWATADETMRNVLRYWSEGRLAELQHLYVPGEQPAAELLETDPAGFDVSNPGSCSEMESKVGGVEAVCSIVLHHEAGVEDSFTMYLVPAPEGGYWLLSFVSYEGTAGGM